MPEQPPPEVRIIDAAMALIAERGLAAVTISEVAKGAGVARQTVYNHFADVDAIVLAVQHRHDPTSVAQIEALLETAATPTQKVELYVRHAIASHESSGGAMALRSSLGPQAREELEAHRAAATEFLAAIIETGVKDGSFSANTDPGICAALINGMLSALDDLATTRTRSDVSRETIRAVLRILGGNQPAEE
jgi:AcrR family transcriptional regulator